MAGLDPNEIKLLEDGIRTVFRKGGEEMAQGICVGDLKPFGDAIIAHEKALAKRDNE